MTKIFDSIFEEVAFVNSKIIRLFLDDDVYTF